MSTRTKKPKRRSVISAQESYTFDDLEQMGYGEETIDQWRSAGVSPRWAGRRHVYLGSEIIDHIKSLPPATPRS